MKKTLIFDFDGVIAETDKGKFALLDEILQDYGLRLPENCDSGELSGLSSKHLLRKLYKFRLSEDDIEEIVKKRRTIYLQNLEKYCVPYELAIDTISDLKNNDFKLYLATINERHIINRLLDYLNIQNCFIKIFSGEDIDLENTSGKDYKHVINSISSHLSDIIVIEDSEFGVRSALETGVFTIHFGHRAVVSEDEHLIHIKNYRELRTYFDMDN